MAKDEPESDAAFRARILTMAKQTHGAEYDFRIHTAIGEDLDVLAWRYLMVRSEITKSRG